MNTSEYNGEVSTKAGQLHCALVSDDHGPSTVSIEDRHALSKVSGGGEGTVRVAARTLSSIVDEVGSPSIDLLSLDVEGYEVQVLRGLDFQRHAPRKLLIECLTDAHRESITVFLQDRYRFEEKLTNRDFLFSLI